MTPDALGSRWPHPSLARAGSRQNLEGTLHLLDAEAREKKTHLTLFMFLRKCTVIATESYKPAQ